MSNFLFLTFPHVLCCDTVRWQMAVVRQKRSVAHRTGWCLPPAVTTFLHRGGAGTTAGGTACSTPLTWSLSTAHRSRSFSSGTTFEDAVSSPEVVLISALCSLFWAEISFRLHNGSVGWYDWQRGRRKVDLGRWNASKHWAVRCLGREGRICLCLCVCVIEACLYLMERSFEVDEQLTFLCLSLVLLQEPVGQGAAWWSFCRGRLRSTPCNVWFQRLKWLQV